MKIIYLFKSLEITIKSLIKAAYPNINTKDFFKWDNIIAYFKSIGIKLSILDGYQDANDLRKVNNCLKHTNTITDEIKKISEFTYSNEFDFNNIDSFYERIKLKVKNFPKLIEQEIVKDLFIFDDERIENIADDFGKRMNPATMSQLIEKLKVAKTS